MTRLISRERYVYPGWWAPLLLEPVTMVGSGRYGDVRPWRLKENEVSVVGETPAAILVTSTRASAA